MTEEQIAAILRTLIQGAGASLVTRGIMTDSQLETAAGALVFFVFLAWGIYARRKAGLIKSAAKLPEVKTVELYSGFYGQFQDVLKRK